MQNFISFVNEQLNREDESPHRHDCHDPPHAAGMGFHDDRSPPRRLAAVARSAPWKATPAQVGFPRDASRRQRLPWVVGSTLWNSSRGEDSLVRDHRGEDCHLETEFCAVSGLRATMIAHEASAFTLCPRYSPRGCLLVQLVLASFRTSPRTTSWSPWFNFLKASMSLYSRVSGEALLVTRIAFGSLSPSRNSWYVSISRAFASLSRVSMLGTVCPFSTLEV